MASALNVVSPNVHYSDKYIEVDYQYQTTSVLNEGPSGYTVSTLIVQSNCERNRCGLATLSLKKCTNLYHAHGQGQDGVDKKNR